MAVRIRTATRVQYFSRHDHTELFHTVAAYRELSTTITDARRKRDSATLDLCEKVAYLSDWPTLVLYSKLPLDVSDVFFSPLRRQEARIRLYKVEP